MHGFKLKLLKAYRMPIKKKNENGFFLSHKLTNKYKTLKVTFSFAYFLSTKVDNNMEALNAMLNFVWNLTKK